MSVLTEIGRYSVFNIYDFMEVASKREDWRNALRRVLSKHKSEAENHRTKSFCTELERLVEQKKKELTKEIFSLENKFNTELLELIDSDMDFIVDVLNEDNGQYMVNYDNESGLFFIHCLS